MKSLIFSFIVCLSICACKQSEHVKRHMKGIDIFLQYNQELDSLYYISHFINELGLLDTNDLSDNRMRVIISTAHSGHAGIRLSNKIDSIDCRVIKHFSDYRDTISTISGNEKNGLNIHELYMEMKVEKKQLDYIEENKYAFVYIDMVDNGVYYEKHGDIILCSDSLNGFLNMFYLYDYEIGLAIDTTVKFRCKETLN